MTGDAVPGELLQRLTDRDEILAGLAAYCRLADLNRPDEQTAVFVEDCRVSYGAGRWIEGRPALTEALRRSLTAYSATSHLLGGAEVDFTGEDGAGRRTAAVQTAVHAWHRRVDGAPDVVLHGRYVDEWVRTPQGWRIRVREFRVAGATGRDETGLNPLGRRPVAVPA